MYFLSKTIAAVAFFGCASTAVAAQMHWDAEAYEPHKAEVFSPPVSAIHFGINTLGEPFVIDIGIPQHNAAHHVLKTVQVTAGDAHSPVLFAGSFLKGQPTIKRPAEAFEGSVHEVPAPSTLSLVIASLGVMAIFKRLKQKSAA